MCLLPQRVFAVRPSVFLSGVGSKHCCLNYADVRNSDDSHVKKVGCGTKVKTICTSLVSVLQSFLLVYCSWCDALVSVLQSFLLAVL